jgi:dCMP deaminase
MGTVMRFLCLGSIAWETTNRCAKAITHLDTGITAQHLPFAEVRMPSQLKLDKTFLHMAYVLASHLSKDPSTKVGALLVSSDHRQLSMGYNGFPSGMAEPVGIWKNKRQKYKRVIHAEINAILNAPFDVAGCTLYCTHRPCHRCMIYALQARVDGVVYRRDYSGPILDERIWYEVEEKFTRVDKL